MQSSRYLDMRRKRYASFDSGGGAAFEAGQMTLKELATLGAEVGEPAQTSGKQELYEALINQAL
jgi:xylose isomerase